MLRDGLVVDVWNVFEQTYDAHFRGRLVPEFDPQPQHPCGVSIDAIGAVVLTDAKPTDQIFGHVRCVVGELKLCDGSAPIFRNRIPLKHRLSACIKCRQQLMQHFIGTRSLRVHNGREKVVPSKLQVLLIEKRCHMIPQTLIRRPFENTGHEDTSAERKKFSEKNPIINKPFGQ